MSIIQVSVGRSHTIFLLKDGTVMACGSNTDGQLGLPKNIRIQRTPVIIPGLQGIVQILAGSSHSLFLLRDGTVMGCGYNLFDQLGLSKDIRNQYTPVIIPNLQDVVQISAGPFHSLFLLKDGTVMACGSNTDGQLGLSEDIQKQRTPVKIPNLQDVIQVSAGSSHSLFLLKDSTVMACGFNLFGQLCMSENIVKQYNPTIIPELRDVVQVSAGSSHSLFLLQDGSVMACGSNEYGRLGLLQDVRERYSPVRIPDIRDVVSILAGPFHSLFLLKDSTVMACGNNRYGQLCMSEYVKKQYTPIATHKLRDIVQVSVGSSHSLFLLRDGTVMGCGNNINGQLGLPKDIQEQYTPVQIL